MGETASEPVLDASALLAYLGDEPGAGVVADALAGGAIISAVNLAEALSVLASRGADPARAAAELMSRGIFDGAIAIEPFTMPDSIELARLRPLTRAAGLSLADRACLALARRRSTLVLTADQAWTGLRLGVSVRSIRATSDY
jgi:PIN domain nuclease of toxin-antitoxin system